jgi:hypothetical protein
MFPCSCGTLRSFPPPSRGQPLLSNPRRESPAPHPVVVVPLLTWLRSPHIAHAVLCSSCCAVAPEPCGIAVSCE